MRCPSLAELPAPPRGKTGWPWTLESPYLPDTRPNRKPWPRISIVTPSFNQCQFIEETIRSVLLQGYPNLEYIIIDGASDDASVELVKRYEPWLSHWVSEHDRGQSHAINKGFEKASGDIFSWINSDDMLFYGCASKVGLCHIRDKNSLYYGDSATISSDDNCVLYDIAKPVKPTFLNRPALIYQHGTFWDANAHQKIDEELNLGMDFDLWLRLVPNLDRLVYLRYPTGINVSRPDTKTRDVKLREAWTFEYNKIIRQYCLQEDSNYDWRKIEFILRRKYRRLFYPNLSKNIQMIDDFVAKPRDFKLVSYRQREQIRKLCASNA
ncbi:glycosyltransferase [bacterium]|nr:glycosyltransferase [bacterium]